MEGQGEIVRHRGFIAGVTQISDGFFVENVGFCDQDDVPCNRSKNRC
jgi:hypothetical protein